MDRRKALLNLAGGLTSLSAFKLTMQGATASFAKLFPTDLPARDWREFPAAGYSQPACGVIYRKRQPPEQGMPLGSIDTGRLNLETNGRLGFCTAYNSICPQRGPLDVPFLGLTIGKQTWVLTSDAGSYGEFMFAGVQTPTEIHYWGHYPVADMEFEMPRCPLSVGLRSWAPFVPGDTAASNTPGAVFELHLRNTSSSVQEGHIAFTFSGPTQAEAQLTTGSPRRKVPFVPFGHTWIPDAPEDTRALRQNVRGEFSGLVVSSEKVKEIGYALGVVGDVEVLTGGGLCTPAQSFPSGSVWPEIGSRLPAPQDTDFSGTVSVSYSVPPGEEKVVRFVLAWFAPMWMGEGPHTFTHMYATRYQNALEVAQFLTREHESLLRRILAWQQVVYAESSLPVWLRDSLVNMLYLFPINSLWAAARPPIGPWCRPEDGLFGMLDGLVEDPAIEPIADTFYANAPLIYFFPDLALSSLRGYKAYQFANGAAVWIWGGLVGYSEGGYQATAGTEFAMPTPGYQTTTNGPAYVDMVDRYWQRTGDDAVLREFYESIKRNTIFTMNLRREDGAEGIISVPSGDVDPQRKGDRPGHFLEWFEAILWFGMTSHVGGIHLANLRMAQRMAEKVGDHAFARQCHEWLEQGSGAMESKMWGNGYYLAYNEPKTGKVGDAIFAYQLDGEWMCRFHGLPGVFRPDRVQKTLQTIRETCARVAPEGVANFTTAEGNLPEGVGYGSIAYFTPELFMLAMTYIYAGKREFGLEIARRAMHALTIVEGSLWNQPNVIAGDTGDRLYGSHYDQNMMLWALPAALEGKDLATFCAPGGFVDRILKAARKG